MTMPQSATFTPAWLIRAIDAKSECWLKVPEASMTA
jgi:hypothetical protein